MESQRWTQIQEVLHEALEREPEERHGFLDEACAGDSSLREEVLSLLHALDEQGPLGTLDTVEARVPIAQSPTVAEQLQRLKDALEDRYIIKEPLGSGGMAIVYLAEDVKHGRPVAVKVLRPDLAASLATERFLREIEICARLHHPHILPLYDSGSGKELLYYVMPLVEGENLAQRIQREGALSTRDALQVGVEVASALEYAHQQGFLHRDIKPANILLSESAGHAMIADFGIARAISVAGGDELTAAGWAIGTPGYMSPEQAAGHPLTPATDVYSLGMVIYEGLTGRRWPGREASPLKTWLGVPLRPARILRRSLARNPEHRWPNTTAFREALWEARLRAGNAWLGKVATIAAAVLFVLLVAAILGTLWRSAG